MPNDDDTTKTPATARLPNETQKAYAAFRAYINLGDDRSLTKLGRKLGKTAAHLGEWSTKYNWLARVALHHSEQAQLQLEADEKAALERARLREQRKNQLEEEAWDVSRLMIKKAKEILAFPIAKQEIKRGKNGKQTVIVMPVNFRAGDAARLLDTADAVGRLANGLPSKVTEITGKGGKDLLTPGGIVLAPRVRLQLLTNAESDKIMEAARKEADGSNA